MLSSVLCCGICADEHRGHDVPSLKDAVAKMRSSVEESLDTLGSTLSVGLVALESSQAATAQLEADYHSTCRAIRESSSALRNAINAREAELLKQAAAMRESAAKRLAQSSAGLEPATAQAQEAAADAKKGLRAIAAASAANGTDTDVLQSLTVTNERVSSACGALAAVLSSAPHPLPQYTHGGLMAYVPSRDGHILLTSLREQ